MIINFPNSYHDVAKIQQEDNGTCSPYHVKSMAKIPLIPLSMYLVHR